MGLKRYKVSLLDNSHMRYDKLITHNKGKFNYAFTSGGFQPKKLSHSGPITYIIRKRCKKNGFFSFQVMYGFF